MPSRAHAQRTTALLLLAASAAGCDALTCGEPAGFFAPASPAARARFANQLAKYHEASAAARPAFLTDRVAASSFPVLGPAGRSADAAAFLNPRVTWTEPTPAVAAFHAGIAPPVPRLALPPAVVAALDAARDDWPRADGVLDLAPLDFSWMAELSRFDHWSLDAHSPWEHERPFDYTTAPIPDFLELLRWARLRLLRGLRDGELATALAENHRLAALVASTEMLIGPLIALALRQLELNLLTPPAGQDLATVKTAVGYFRRALQHTEVSQEPATLAALLDPRGPGGCALVQETLWNAYRWRPVAEPEFGKAYAILDGLLKATESPCRWTLLRQVWSERGKTGRFLDELSGLDGSERRQALLERQVKSGELSRSVLGAAPAEQRLRLLAGVVPGRIR